MRRRIAVGSDHRGFHVKSDVIRLLREQKHEVIDCGADSDQSVDYPDYALKVAEKVVGSEADFGILFCGTGVGMSIAANKVRGIRAAAVHDEVTAEISRRYNDSNILCLSADLVSKKQIDHIIEIWLQTEFEGGRHARRLGKIDAIERTLTEEPKS